MLIHKIAILFKPKENIYDNLFFTYFWIKMKEVEC